MVIYNSPFRVTVNAKNEQNSKYRVECSDGMIDVEVEDIVTLTDIDKDLEVKGLVNRTVANVNSQVGDTVLARHPHYKDTYAPGVVVRLGVDKLYQIRFYDGTEGFIRRSETHQVDPGRFEKMVDYILQLEQRWIDQTVVARFDPTGIYKIGFTLSNTILYYPYFSYGERPDRVGSRILNRIGR